LYWAPTPREAEQQRIEQRIAHPDVSSSAIAQAASIFTPPGPMTFIAMTPCRVMDTRAGQGFTGAFGPPSLAAFGAARQVPMPSSTTCTIPSNAGAYSLNITAVSPGALSFLSVWPAGAAYPNVSTLNDSAPTGGAVANAAIVPAGTAGAIQMLAGNITDVIIDINGYYATPTDGNQNTAIGAGALQNTAGGLNTAIGAGALQNNIGGGNNTATGAEALHANTSGSANTADGSSALGNNSGSDNTASGYLALSLNTNGGGNTASGANAMQNNSVGSYNTAIGYGALVRNTSGGLNIAIGQNAALNVSGGNSNNIHIGSEGASGDSGVIEIGTQGTQTTTYIAGIYGGTPSTSNLLVCVDANGQLGTTGCSSTASSRRFKEQITDMGDASSKLFQLRPVNFFYKPQYDDGSHLLQYGLIAEEVAKLYPEMVGYDKDGQPSSVKYQSLAPMLLNEVQKQNAQLQKQAEAIQLQAEENRKLEERLAALEALLSSQTLAPSQPSNSQ